jgi:hypothetical protein
VTTAINSWLAFQVTDAEKIKANIKIFLFISVQNPHFAVSDR